MLKTRMLVSLSIQARRVLRAICLGVAPFYLLFLLAPQLAELFTCPFFESAAECTSPALAAIQAFQSRYATAWLLFSVLYAGIVFISFRHEVRDVVPSMKPGLRIRLHLILLVIIAIAAIKLLAGNGAA
jgi:hypothetical protein